MTNKQRIDALHKRQAISRALFKRLEKENMTEIQAPTVPVQEYEYFIDRVPFEKEKNSMQEMHDHGWELISVSPIVFTLRQNFQGMTQDIVVQQVSLYFKRKKAT